MAHPIPDDPEALLTRAMTAEALSAAGYPVKRATLATKASRGGGPRFRRFGAKPLYRWGDALEWAQSLLGPPMCSTSEADAATGQPVPPRRRVLDYDRDGGINHIADVERYRPPRQQHRGRYRMS
jgi:hypothetical protein